MRLPRETIEGGLRAQEIRGNHCRDSKDLRAYYTLYIHNMQNLKCSAAWSEVVEEQSVLAKKEEEEEGRRRRLDGDGQEKRKERESIGTFLASAAVFAPRRGLFIITPVDLRSREFSCGEYLRKKEKRGEEEIAIQLTSGLEGDCAHQ